MEENKRKFVLLMNSKIIRSHLEGIKNGKYSHPVERDSILDSCINYINDNIRILEKK